jgi:TorA maturation chaperone TorD
MQQNTKFPMNPLDSFCPDELQAYALALKVEAMAFYLPPSEPFLASLLRGDLLNEWPLAPDAPLTLRGLQLVRAALGVPPANLLPELRSDYTALFVGLEQVDAPPWESVYLSRDHLLFDAQTLEVRAAYARYGLQIPKLDHEPDDHIGFELLFLSHLLGEAAQALTQGDAPAAQARLLAAQDFLQAHPQRWVDQFAARVDRFAGNDYYRGLALLLLSSLAGLEEVLCAAFASREVQA